MAVPAGSPRSVAARRVHPGPTRRRNTVLAIRMRDAPDRLGSIRVPVVPTRIRERLCCRWVARSQLVEEAPGGQGEDGAQAGQLIDQPRSTGPVWGCESHPGPPKVCCTRREGEGDLNEAPLLGFRDCMGAIVDTELVKHVAQLAFDGSGAYEYVLGNRLGRLALRYQLEDIFLADC